MCEGWRAGHISHLTIISKEMIKPSSPTPHHLRELKLSLLDQVVGVRVYVPFLLFYSVDEGAGKSQQLKQSLSDTLTVFYPLAGELYENASIDCNDNGAEFTEARVHARVSDFIDDPNLEELKRLIPVDSASVIHNIVLSVQASFFDCGGIVVGVAMSHKLGDANSMVEFIRAWATTCRGEIEMIVQPRFDLTSHFPPLDLPLPVVFQMVPQPEKVVTKRLIFNKEKLKELKIAISSAPGSELKDPSRVEAATAYIWKHRIAAARENNVEKPSSAALHVVNIRPKMIPPLPEQAFGNCILTTPHALASKDDCEMHHLAYVLRKAIRRIDGDYIKEVQADTKRYCAGISQSLDQILKGGTILYGFTSWCRFPMYEVDYGWGKPVWACMTPAPINNAICLMNTPCGEGIEAWVNLLEDDTKVFGLID